MMPADKIKALTERLRDTSVPILEVIRERANDKQFAADAIEQLTADRDALRLEVKELVQSLKLIEHATAPTPNDGGSHENAYTLAKQALSLHKWGVV